MSGSIEEIPLPDLLQLLSTSRKSGVLVLRSDWGIGQASTCARGRSTSPSIDDSFNVGPRKAMFRMLTWKPGHLRARAARRARGARGDAGLDRGAAHGGHAPARRVPGDHREAAGAWRRRIAVPRPLSRKLRELTPEELDVFQLALEATTVNALFDQLSLHDLEIAQKLVTLFEKGYLVAG